MITRDTVLIIAYTGLFYSVSLTLGFFSSYVLSKKNYNFRFPLFITAVQNLIHFILSNGVITTLKIYRNVKRKKSKEEKLNESNINPTVNRVESKSKDTMMANNDISELNPSLAQAQPKPIIPLYLVTIMPCAVSAALDIGMSSHALRSVTLAFYTMIKSSSPVFVVFSGFLFGIERPSFKLFLTIFIIGAGVFVTTIKTDKVTTVTDLSLSKPTMFLLFASFMGGFRWAFVQFLLEKRKLRKKNIIYTIRDLCLPIGILLFTFSLYFEGFNNVIRSEFFQNENAIRRNIIFILISGLLSFILLVTEFLLVSKTSVVYLSVSGIVKELMIVFVSVCRKEIKFETINYCGLGMSIVGMVLYNVSRMKIE